MTRIQHLLKGFILGFSLFVFQLECSAQRPIAIAIHGGAGSISEENMSEETQEEYEAKLLEAINTGKEMLEKESAAEDVVVTVLQILESSPLFNAGVGAVLTHDETVSLDASIMRGSDLNAGAVSGVDEIKSPIAAAQLVMNESAHVMLHGDGAEAFARSEGCEMVEPEYFIIQKQIDRVRSVKAREAGNGDLMERHPADGLDEKMGTVGCVVLDQAGNLAAGTSTGGMTNKRHGRIGDSPIIGAGTYANNRTCAVSCTGHGEYFIRLSVAHEISALVEHKKMTSDAAAKVVIHQKLEALGGTGGVIVLDRNGKPCWAFNTQGMFRAKWRTGEDPEVRIFGSED